MMLISSFFELILSPFQSVSPLWALILFSSATAFLILIVFRFTSDQQRIRETKNAIKAHVLEMWLFRDNLRIILSAQWQIFRLNGRYLRLTTGPMLVMIVPLSLMLISLDGWFGYRPMRPGEQAIVSLWVSEGRHDLLETALLEANGGITVETPPLRIPLANEVDWRIRANTLGKHTLQVKVAGHNFEKSLVVSEKLIGFSRRRGVESFWNTLLNPKEQPIPRDSPVEQIEVGYPARTISIFGWKMHWIAVFFLISIISVFALKGIFRVEV